MPMIELMLRNGQKNPIQKIYTQLYKHLIGLNKRATNKSRQVMKQEDYHFISSHIYLNVIKFWLHLVNLPDTSIAKQCLLLSNQLANNRKPSFILSFHEIMKVQYCSTRIRVEPNLVNSKLPKVKQAIIDNFKKDQIHMLRSYKKMNFYSIFKTGVYRSEYSIRPY